MSYFWTLLVFPFGIHNFIYENKTKIDRDAFVHLPSNVVVVPTRNCKAPPVITYVAIPLHLWYTWHMCSYQRNFKCHRDTKTETVPYVSHNIKNYHPRWIDTFDKLPENSWIAHVKYLLFIEHWRTFAINLFVICASVTLYQCMNRSTEFQRWRVVWTGEIEIVCSIWIVYCLCSMSMSCFCVCMGIVYKQSANIA